MKKKYLSILSILFIFVCTYCSADKETFVDIPSTTNMSTDYVGQDFTLLPQGHVPDSDLYLEGGILQDQDSNLKYNKTNRNWQGIASVGKDRLGNLYAAWISGGKWEGNENYITVSLSKDKGRTWNHGKLIFYVNPEDSTRVMDASLFNDKFGNLYIAWAKHIEKKKIINKLWAETWYSKLKLSETTGIVTYTSPRRIAPGIMINKPFNSGITDQMIFPVAVWYAGNPILQQPFMYKGNYGSNNLGNFAKVGGITMNVSKQHMIYEHMFVELRDSSYLGMTRAIDGIYYSKSKDGKTWDVGKKFTDLGPVTSARFHLAKLKSGRLILIFNNATIRTNMTIYLSDDDGVTWPYKMVIDTRNNVSYPDMIETDPGILNIVYDYARAPAGEINFVIVKEGDIIKSRNLEVFRTKISSLQ